MSVGVPKEITPLEKRVAQTPDTVSKLVKMGITVNVEKGAGEASKCSDKGYAAVGANIVGKEEVREGREGARLIFFMKKRVKEKRVAKLRWWYVLCRLSPNISKTEAFSVQIFFSWTLR